MWKSQGERFGMYGGCLSVFQSNLWSLSLIILTVWGWALSCKRMIPSDTIPATKKRTTPLCSSLLACISNAGRTHYTKHTSGAIKEQLCGPVRFHYAFLLTYRWQHRYVTMVLPAFVGNVFCGGCSVFIWVPLIFLVILFCCVTFIFIAVVTL